MRFFLAHRLHLATDFLNMPSLGHTERQWFVLPLSTSVTWLINVAQVAVFVGELIGHFLNDAIMHVSTRRNNGVFEAENRLW
jgi:hypothetical protein